MLFLFLFSLLIWFITLIFLCRTTSAFWGESRWVMVRTLFTSYCFVGDVPIDVPRDRRPLLCAWRHLAWRRARWPHRGGRTCSLLLGVSSEVFEQEQCSFFFRWAVAFTREAICSQAFLCWEIFDDRFNVLAQYSFIQILYFFLSQFW